MGFPFFPVKERLFPEYDLRNTLANTDRVLMGWIYRYSLLIGQQIKNFEGAENANLYFEIYQNRI